MKYWKTALNVVEDVMDNNPTACMPKYMKQLEVKSGVSRAVWFFGILLTFVLMLYLIGGLRLIANLIGFGFPARASFKAIDSPNAHESVQWLSYWVIFGAFFTLENAFWFLPVRIPYYNIMKMLVLVYSFHPTTKGATLVYDTVIRPLVIQHVLPGSAARGAPPVTVPQVSELVSPPHNELRVVVISASDIVPVDTPGAKVDCDPYCVLEVLPEGSRPKNGSAEQMKYKTMCKLGTADPVWNEIVTIPRVQQLDAKLVVTVCNKRAMGRDECLGKIEVPLSDSTIIGSGSEVIQALSPVEGTVGSTTGNLRINVQRR